MKTFNINKTKATFLSLGIITSLLLISCESLVNEVDPKRIPKNEQKLVINCYISPQDSLIVAKLQYSDVVFQTRSVDFSQGYTTRDIIAKDAKIEISEGGRSIELKYDTKEQFYVARTKDFKIEAGKTYTLKATDGKNRAYAASTTVPGKINIDVKKPEQVPTQNRFEQANYWQVPVVWKAPANSYYRLGIWDTRRSEFKNQDGKITTVETTPQNGFWDSTFQNNNEGVEKELKAFPRFYEYVFPPEVQNNEKIVKRTVRFLHVDKNYESFHRSIRQNSDNGNPFVEPTLVASNIENGYGCFGSYFQIDKEYRF